MPEKDSTRGATAGDLNSFPHVAIEDQSIRAKVALRPQERYLRGWFVRTGAVLAEVGIAFAIRELVAHRAPPFAPFIPFYPAVLLASLLDGIWAGIAVTVVATLLADLWVFPPFGSLK